MGAVGANVGGQGVVERRADRRCFCGEEMVGEVFGGFFGGQVRLWSHRFAVDGF